MKTVYSEKHKLRNARTELCAGELVAPFEHPRRAEMILAALRRHKLGDVIAPTSYGLAPVNAVHDSGYLSFLENCMAHWRAAGLAGEAIASCWPTRRMDSGIPPRTIEGLIGYYALAAETSISDGTFEAAQASADVALTATELVLAGERAAFGLCRPPGHHAAFDQFGGYCFLNNAAIAAEHARAAGIERVAILDVDFHHGNGTQDIFYDRADVFFLSIHGDPLDAFPYFLGHAAETGAKEGDGFTRNFPLPPGTQYAVWKRALDQALDRIVNYAPGLLIISLGTDTFEKDPISFFKLTHDDFADYGALVGAAQLPTVYLLEGGYAVDDIGENVANVLLAHQDALS